MAPHILVCEISGFLFLKSNWVVPRNDNSSQVFAIANTWDFFMRKLRGWFYG